MVIDQHSKIPLYYQLKDDIKKKILKGDFQEGDLLPSEREFSERYDISSTTIRRALNDLVHENFLERKAGKGTFVRRGKVKRDLRKVLGFTQNMKEMGLVPSTQVLSKKSVLANAFARERLGLKRGTRIVRLNRLRLANDIPMMLETRYIRTDLCPGIQKQELSSSLWKVFENVYGCKPYRHSQNLRITTISGNAASLLGLGEDSLVFLIKGVTYLEDGQAIECEESLYRSDKYDLAFEAIID
ncbi:MAG: GntR family transcriptional regulator [Desulfobacteraceae bacterium]|nr:GntR family transcriptional regulator [Desulfobacteraceae bacterium]